MDGRAPVSTSLTFHQTPEIHTGKGGEGRLGVRHGEIKPVLVLLIVDVFCEIPELICYIC